ncbi:MAG: S8 family serine peptidase [Saprospiraceae bacterium]|nr:S8 family serine peptidase [Saprospiraceae bacterium]
MKLFHLAFLCLFVHLQTYAQSLDHVKGDVLIQMKYGHDIRPVLQQLETFQGKPTNIKLVKNASTPLRIWLLHFDWTSIDETAFLDHVRSIRGVEMAQLNHFISLRETTPNDPIFNAQWQWVNNGQGGGTPDADVDADLAWDITTGGTSTNGHDIVVCVVEGTNRNHTDLQGNLWVNDAEIPENGIDDDNNGYVDDYNGWNTGSNSDNIPSQQHGTQVSGMIGAKGNNQLFATGINWDVKIMHVEFGNITESNVVEAYTYPLIQRRRFNQTGGQEGAFVVATNSSWGIDNGDPSNSPLWCAFYDSLGVEGILSCGATANNNVNIDQVLDLPTACTSEFLISVTASNNKDQRTFSGYGTTHVDVAAPGESIVTISTNGGPSTTSGTSFATPLTAGIIALMYAAPCSTLGDLSIADPAAAAKLVRDALYAGVDVKPNLLSEVKYGGRVNAFNSLNILLQNCGPCPRPYAVEITDIIDTAAVFSWISPDSTIFNNIRFRALGDTNWVQVDSVSSPFILNGLSACTEYEIQLEAICASDTSGFNNVSLFFETDGCCVAPENLSVSQITPVSALVNWEQVFAANNYNLLLTSSLGDSIVLTTSGNSLMLDNLATCVNYQIQVQTVCDTGTTNFTLPISFTTLGCGACQDFVYCSTTGENTETEWIEKVQIGFIDNTSGNNGGYGDFTGASWLTTELLTYSSNPITLTPGFSGGTYPEWFTVYIDFNQDGDFNDPNEKAFDTGATTTTSVTGSIVIPGTAAIGTTRMRVIMRWNTAPSGPCAANFNFGEVEDYCISINAGTAPNCVVPNSLAISDTTTTTALLTWDAVPDANGYTVQYRKIGITGWTTKLATTNSLMLDPLEFCKEYEVHVRSNCTGLNSEYSGSIFFSTLCISSTFDEALATELGLSISPNPFSEELKLRFRLNRTESVSLELSDLCGRTVFQQKLELAAGGHDLLLTPNVAAGVYFLQLKLVEGQIARKVIRF